MKKFLLSLAAVGLALLTASRAPAQDDNKPLLVLSLPSVESLLKDIAYLGKVVGREGIDKIAEDLIDARAGGLKGLDRKKSIGLAATTDGAGFQVLAFIPASDAESLLALIPIPAEDAGDGVKKLPAPIGGGIFLKESKGWLFISNEASSLGKLPADPTKLLDGLDKKYDVGLQIFMQNIPPLYKGLAISGIKTGLERGLKRNEDESDEAFERREKVVKQQIDTLIKTINDMDKITLGWSVDEATKKLFMDVAATAVADSDTAKRYAAQADAKSNFGGFWRDDATMSVLAASKMSESDAAQLVSTLAEGRRALMAEIDKSSDFENEAQKAKVKDLAGRFVDVLEGTLKSGQLDVGMTVLGEGPFNFALGLGVADGDAAKKALVDAVKLAESEGVLEKVEYDVAKADDVTFHSITPKLGDGAEAAAKVFGKDPKVVFATGKKSLYIGVGSDAVKSLQGLIEKSKSSASRTASGAQMVVSLAPFIKYAAKQDPLNDVLSKIAAAVIPGSDRIRVSGKPITNGEQTRIEIDEGVIKLIAGVAKLRGAGE